MGCCTSQEEFRGALLYLEHESNKRSLHPEQYVSEDYVVQKGNPPAIIPKKNFLVELGTSLLLKEINIQLDNKDRYSLYYRNNFAPKEHINFIGGSINDPVILSVQFNPNSKGINYKVIVRNKKFDSHFEIKYTSSKSELLRLLYSAFPLLAQAKLREIKDEKIIKDLTHIEDRLLIKSYKFGIIYCKDGQTSDDQMFSNQTGSKEFEEFLSVIGEKVRLKGWKEFDGELDVKTDTTGTHSVFTTVENLQIMFHVSTMLPYSDVNPQQIERKRHIGNDICCIIFQDSTSTPFTPDSISSHYNHVYAVVQVVNSKKKSNNHSSNSSNKSGSSGGSGKNKDKKRKKEKTKYRVAFVSKQGVSCHGPVIPNQGIFEGGSKAFRLFLLTKLINAERAAYSAPSFGVTRTRANLLRDIMNQYAPSP